MIGKRCRRSHRAHRWTLAALAAASGLMVLACCADQDRARSPASKARPSAAPPAPPEAGRGDVKSSPDGGAPAGALSPEDRRALFERLVAEVRRRHVFAPRTAQNLGRAWEDDLPALEREFIGAASRRDLVIALLHFANSLHNPHCTYTFPDKPERLYAGFDFAVEWAGGAPSFYVDAVRDPDLQGRLAPGDVLVSVDGVRAGDLLERLILQSNANHWRGIALDIARFLTTRTTLHATTSRGDTTEWVFAARDDRREKAVQTAWKAPPPERPHDDFAIDYDSSGCAGLPARSYGPYRLAGQGQKFCIYASDDPRYRAYPIVRQFSFAYTSDGEPDGLGRRVRVDREALERQLRSLPGARGVILDLRDNRGGRNPNWFMDWWAPAPYVDRWVVAKLMDDLDDEEKLRAAGLRGREWGHYLKALRARAPGQVFAPPRPMFCRGDACDWDNRYTPAHPVTLLPVALLVGPACVSSCDAVALQFSENGFGPLIGEPTAAGHSTQRVKYDVTLPGRGEPFGAITLAVSYELSGKTREDIEAAPIRLDYPLDRTFDNRGRYDQELVDAAARAFREFPFPKRQGGPRATK